MNNKKSTTRYGVLPVQVKPFLAHCPYVLRITEHKDKPIPVFVVKERQLDDLDGAPKRYLKDLGQLYGLSLRRCLPVIKTILSRVVDDSGIPLELHNVLSNARITFRGNLPLDEQAGAKLALICKLQEHLQDMDRVELIAWRVNSFSREEAMYWLSRVTQYGPAGNRWAKAGLRLMLGGQPGDKAVLEMLDKLRE